MMRSGDFDTFRSPRWQAADRGEVHSLARPLASLVILRVRSRTSVRDGARYAGSNIDRPLHPGGAMSGIRIYQAYHGWIYEVWFQGRVVIIGCCASLEAAQRAAAS